MTSAKTAATDWRTELLRRVDIAADLESQIERLLKLMKLDGPLRAEDESRVDEVRLGLNRIAIQLQAEPALLNDVGERTTMVGWSLPVNRHQYFRNGASRFLLYFQEMEAGIFNWGLSNWGHNRKYTSKFQSAGVDLRAFIAAARAMLTDRDYHTCRREIQVESLEQKRASQEEQARMIQAVADKLRANSDAAKRVDIEEVINSLCGPARLAEPRVDASEKNKEPTRLEIDTYKVYSAVQAYLESQGAESKPSQAHIHSASKTLLDDVLDRDCIGVSEDYTVQPNFDAFTRAYRRAREWLSAG